MNIEKAEIRTLAQAEQAARRFARATRVLDRIEAQLKDFAENSKAAIGRSRVLVKDDALGQVTIGFRRVPPSLAISGEGDLIVWLKKEYGDKFVEVIERVDRPLLKSHIEERSGRMEELAQHGVAYREATEVFFVKTTNGQ
jgi:Bacteriophage Mu Gam like protein